MQHRVGHSHHFCAQHAVFEACTTSLMSEVQSVLAACQSEDRNKSRTATQVSPNPDLLVHRLHGRWSINVGQVWAKDQIESVDALTVSWIMKTEQTEANDDSYLDR